MPPRRTHRFATPSRRFAASRTRCSSQRTRPIMPKTLYKRPRPAISCTFSPRPLRNDPFTRSLRSPLISLSLKANILSLLLTISESQVPILKPGAKASVVWMIIIPATQGLQHVAMNVSCPSANRSDLVMY